MKQEERAQAKRFFTWLAQQQTIELPEVLMMENGGDFVCISDLDSYEVYVLKTADGHPLPDQWQNYQGRLCYELLQGLTEPCPFCKNHLLQKGRYLVWKHDNSCLGKRYILKDKLIEWKGKTARLEVARDMTDMEQAAEILIDALDGQNMLVSCMQALVDAPSMETAVPQLLQHIQAFFAAKECSMFCFSSVDQERGFSFRLVDKRVQMESFEIDESWIAQQAQLLKPGWQILLKDLESQRAVQPEAYAYYQSLGVQSICVTPVWAHDRLVALLCVLNPRRHWGELSLMNALAMNMANYLQRQIMELAYLRMRTYDELTGYRNFAQYKQEVAEIWRHHQDKQYALWYCDLKNFKYVNDVFGYDVGNRLLKFWADLIDQETREGETFTRVSADNFSLFRVYEDVSELESCFLRMAKQLTTFDELVNRKVKLEVAAGVYLIQSPQDWLSLEEMMNRANLLRKA